MTGRLSFACFVAALAGCSSAAHATEDTRQFYCSATALGNRGDSVDVALYVQASGEQVGSSASWTPPHAHTASARFTDKPDLDFWILYIDPTDQDIGPPTFFDVSTSVFDAQRSTRRLARTYAGLKVSVRLDDSAESTVPLVKNRQFQRLPHYLALNADLAPEFIGTTTEPKRIDSVRILHLNLIDRNGHTLTTDTFDLSAPDERDSLFHLALGKAKAKAANPKSCDLTQDGLLDTNIPDQITP